MRLCFLATLALLGGSALAVHADYVIIKVDLAAKREKLEDAPPPGAAQMAGRAGVGIPGMGVPGQAGGLQGMNQGGLPGAPGLGAQVPGGIPGAGQGFPGMRQGLGMAPMGPLGQMGPGGMRAGPGMGQMGPGGLRGGGIGGVGMGGQFPGMQGQFTSRAAGQDDDEEIESSPLVVRAIIEADHTAITKVRDIYKRDTRRKQILHKWGRTITYYSPGEISVEVKRIETVAQRYSARRHLIKDDEPEKTDRLIDLARWALAHGLEDKVDAIMDELAKSDPKNHIVATFMKVRDAINRDVTGLDPGVSWRDRLGDFAATNSKHYVLISDVKTQKEAQSRLDALETNFKDFYYWFALRGKLLSVPKYRLVAALESSRDALERHRKDIFDNVVAVADGFYVPRDNLAIISNQPLDEGYEALDKTSQPYWRSWNQDELFQMKPPNKQGFSANEKARAETFALLLRALKAEADVATISHEGTRQLLVASGIVPRSIVPPAWIEYGIPSFFETPKGAYWRGFGESHVVYHANFQRWQRTKNKNFEADPAAALKAVVTDQYFREASQGKFKDPKDQQTALTRARTMSWALAFYLANTKLDGLLRYYQELSSMPRDIALDPDTLILMFARAFNLVQASNPNQVDPNRFSNFASAWYEYLVRTPLEIQERDPKPDSKKEADTKGPAAKPY
jgi:hypothetical protein